MSSIEKDEKTENTSNIGIEEMNHKLQNCCRLCLDERRTKIDLHAVTSRRIQLSNAEIFMSFCEIQVGLDDGLPQMICTKCENMLHLILDFLNECRESNNYLMDMLNSLESKRDTNKETSDIEIERNEIEIEEEDNNMTVETLEPEFDENQLENHIEMKNVLEHEAEEYELIENEEYETDQGTKDNIIVISVVESGEELTPYETTIPLDDKNFSIEKRNKSIRKKNSKCPECGKMVEGPAKLTRHMRVHERAHKKSVLQIPVKKHDDTPKIYSCDVCKKEFNLMSRLKKHLETHLPMSMREKSFICYCGKQYLDSGALRSHRQIAHSDNIQMYACEICNKEFTRKNYRDYHQRLHTSDKPHACELCSFRSAKRHNLVRHMLVHSDEYNFSCDSCGKKFKRKHGLDYHKNVHNCGSDQSYMCPECKRAYTSKSHLISHFRQQHEINISIDELNQLIHIQSDTTSEIKEEGSPKIGTEEFDLVYAIEEFNE